MRTVDINFMRTRDSRRTTSSTGEIGLDRISSLPDPIICHIISFLPTRYTARTSVLSTKWKYLFLYVPKIILADSELLSPDAKRVNENLHFIEFANRRLMLSQTASITEFRLKWQKMPLSVSRTWLTTLLFRNVEVLDIEEPLFCNIIPPSELFVSQTLWVLKLHGRNIILKIPQSVCFPKLKVLHLTNIVVQFHSDSRIFAEGYPVIEDLRLENVHFRNSEDRAPLRIFLSTLQKLAIVAQEERNIDIDTPHLQQLIIDSCCYHDYIYTEVKLCRCDSIVSIDLHGFPDFSLDQVSFTVLLNHVNKVKELRISMELSDFKEFPAESLPQFPKLTNLELAADEEMFWMLLQRAPILKALVYDMDDIGDCYFPLSAPVCFAENLREIKLKRFIGSREECTLAMYLMQHAAVLEKMTIELINGLKIQELPRLKQLIKHKSSSTCLVEILERCS